MDVFVLISDINFMVSSLPNCNFHLLNLGGRNLLFLSLDEGVDPEFCKLLIEAGARADLFNVDLEMAPIHEAVMSGLVMHARNLLETHPLNKV